jgi:hypothetical protein
LLRETTSSLAISSTLWLSSSRHRRDSITQFLPDPLFGFGVPPEFSTVEPSRAPPRARRTRPLSWAFVPFSTYQPRGSTDRRPCLARFVPPSGFGDPLDGLLPSRPGRACFIPTALVGFIPSERSPPAR